MVAGLAYAYENRDFIIDAYDVEEQTQPLVVEDRPVADISDYIDLSKIRTLDYRASDFVIQDTRRVDLPIPTRTAIAAPEPKVQGGTGAISGRVTFDGEPVPQADVQVERIIGDVSSSINVKADAGGRFRAPQLLGGRYRVRAFLPPSLSMRNAEVLFLPENGQAEGLELSLSNESSSKFSGRFQGDVARVGSNHTVIIEFRNAQVNSEGIIEDGPVPNELVAITVREPLVVNGSILTTSNANGVARFVVSCSAEGNGRITITSRNQDQNVPVPPCTLPPRPQPQPIPIGDSFSQPNETVAPRGTFQARPAPQNNGGNGNNGGNNNGGGNGNNNGGNGNNNGGNNSGRGQGTTTTGQSPTSTNPGSSSTNPGPTSTEARTAESRAPQGFAPRSFRFQPNLASVFAGSAVCAIEYQLWDGQQWGPVFAHNGGTPVVFNSIARVLPSNGIPCEYVRVA